MIDPLRKKYQHYLRRFASLDEALMRRSVARDLIFDPSNNDAVWMIDQILRGAIWGQSVEIDAMVALAGALIETRACADHYEMFKSLFLIAANEEREGVLFLLRDPPNHREMIRAAKLPEVRLPISRDTTLGERCSLARTHATLWKFLQNDPNPRVLREVLRNPRLKVKDVQLIAARRPSYERLISEVVTSSRWFKEPLVREAVVQNPFTRTGSTLRILPSINFSVIHHISKSGGLHDSVVAFAKYLVKLRQSKSAPVNTLPKY